jgi:hypothetical protein
VALFSDLGQIEVCADDNTVSMSIQRVMKKLVAFFRLVENDVEHHDPRASAKQTVDQNCPKFARPRVTVLSHQLKGAVPLDFFRSNRTQAERLLVDPNENKIRVRRRLASFAPQHIGKAALTAPDRGKKRRRREKMSERDEAGPKNCNQAQEPDAVPVKPMHARILAKIAK